VRSEGTAIPSAETAASCTIPQLDESTFEAAVLASPVPVFLHFAERDCQGCEMAKRCLAGVTEQARGRLKCFCIHGPKAAEVTARYHVGQYPTILVFREGRVARRLVGHPLPGELEVILRTELP
jgi:thioredoxin 1